MKMCFCLKDCVKKQVCFIYKLQKMAECQEKKLLTCTTCDAKQLGEFANTRPFSLFLKNGDLFEVPIEEPCKKCCKYDDDCCCKPKAHGCQPKNTSCVFRVEKKKCKCATLRALKCIDGKLYPTNFCVNVNLKCFCAIQCYKDINLKLKSCCSQ